MGVHRRIAVVGAAALAAVAAEDPAVEVDARGGFALDGVAGDAAAGIDHAGCDDGSRGAALDAVAAAAAARPLEGFVVAVGLVRKDQLAQYDEAAQARRHEQRLTADPAQPGLHGELLFEQRRRIDERPASQPGPHAAQLLEKPREHRPHGRMVIRGAGIGGDFRAAAGGIALARAVFVSHGADDGRARALHQAAGIEALVEVALQVAQRGVHAPVEPAAEPLLVLRQVAARRHAAKVEADLRGEVFDNFGPDHRNILVQK